MPPRSKAPAADGPQRRLVIVESPAKARTIQGYLGPGYEVEASVGHIRDLPKRAADIPAKYKGEKWAKLGVNVDDGFEPLYVVDADKKTKVAELKRKLADADELLLATDEDREGEAIAWHLLEVLKPKVPVKRMVFHEITKAAIQQAAESTRDLDQNLVDAQETRRILDRLYGYEVSPVLWKKVMPRLSAGRVQSVATRLVVQRERERIAHRAAEYWDVQGVFEPGAFDARLVAVDGARVAQGRDFDSLAALKSDGLVHLDEATATSLAEALGGASFAVRSLEDKPYKRSPAAPFMTSTLQQEAGRKLRWSSQRTMRVAQGLYERGFITYMRTDSTTLSETALAAARAQAAELYGPEYVSEVPRRYEKKVKNAQEAHEAVRPSGDVFRTPAEVAGELVGDDFALYELIWKRTVASQMTDARGTTATLRLGATASDGRDAEFSVSGTIITFRGFLAAYEESSDEDAESADGKDGKEKKETERRLPNLKVGDLVTASALLPEGHSTSPPARYTEASLVKALEERGIGRPSTYASIMGTIVDRGYVMKRGSALVPSFLAFAVTKLLEEHFPTLVDYSFTASMEEGLDEIASGDAGMVAWLTRFYFGDGAEGAARTTGLPEGPDMSGGLHALVSDIADIDAREINSFDVGNRIVLRVGRYGPYVERWPEGVQPGTEAAEGVEPERANVPEDLAPDELTTEKAEELLAAPSGDFELGTDPATGLQIVAKSGRYGPYVTEVLPEDAPKDAKPKTASLFKDMSIDTITLDDALRLLTLPRVVGTDAEGVEITAQNGRYGPYLKKGTDSRSLTSEEQLFTITLDEALAIYAQPKQRGRAAARPPLRELGVDPAVDKPIVVKEGRFGAYVTDGEYNATLRKGDTVDSLTIERAADLLAEKRAMGPPTKKPRKTAAKKPASTTKRTVKKKTAAKKK